MSPDIRVLIADDHKVVRDCVSRYLDSQEGLTVVGKVADGAAAVKMTSELRPDVVIMDYNMPEIDGEQATREIVAANSGTVVIAVSMHDDGPVEKAMLEAGAVAYLSKNSVAAKLLDAIRKHVPRTTSGETPMV